MRNFLASAPAVFISTTLLALATIGTGAAVRSLETATAHQCANHLWPASAHDVHIEWCRDNGYVVR